MHSATLNCQKLSTLEPLPAHTVLGSLVNPRNGFDLVDYQSGRRLGSALVSVVVNVTTGGYGANLSS
eukprot:6677171-Lingulodinium_polyedra.AAC.1